MCIGKKLKLIIEADGGSRGNPGPAAYGCLVKDAQTNIESGIESMTSENNQLQKDVTESIREVEANNRTTEKDLRAAMRQLEMDMNQKLQEALNNPLSK